jgi:holo-[acyl-carrier protein] synthase
MIIGIGSDVINIQRIEKILSRYGNRFINRIFTPIEQQKASQLKEDRLRASAYAKRFAAKEAVAKAIGTGFGNGVWFDTIEIRNLANGKPVVELKKEALSCLQKLIPEGMEPKIELSMSDDYPLAQAFVIIYAKESATKLSK